MRAFFLVLLLAWFALGGCAQQEAPTFKGSDIRSAEFGGPLLLRDHRGQPRSLADFRGRVVVLFFGYTHCPDVCPTTLSDMAAAFKLLGPERAAQVQVLFVTVDPERDTPELLGQYVPYFHPDFLGLHGTSEEVARAAKDFRIVYRRHVEAGASDYLIDHTAGSYVLDRAGRLRLFLPFAQSAPDIAHDLERLLAEG